MHSVHSIALERNPEAGKAEELLEACFAEGDPLRAEAILGELIAQYVQPTAARIVASRLRLHGSAHHGQIEDVTSEAVVAFLLYVQDQRGEDQRGAGGEPIRSVQAFAATLAGRACNDYFRRTHPAFHGLRNKLRYLFETYPDIVRWKNAAGEWLCSPVAWQAAGMAPRTDVEEWSRSTWLEQGGDADAHPADQLARVLRQLGAPVRFNDLALLMARLWNVQETNAEPEEEEPEFADAATPVDVTLGRREWLAGLWEQIGKLNRNQRTALLLNLRTPDGSCAASLLVMTGVVSVRKIAQAVEMPAEEFVEVWKRLPLNDIEIAEMLALTRQQVINLRKCARERLARHTGGYHRSQW